MYKGNTIFQMLCQLISRYDFENICSRFFASNSARSFTHKNHFQFMMYCIIQQVSSLREGVTNFNFMYSLHYHLGFSKKVSLSTVSEANSKRDCNFYKALFHTILSDSIRSVRKKLSPIVHLLDATTISILDNRSFCSDVSMSHRGLKLHVLLDYESSLPSFVRISSCRKSDISAVKDSLIFERDHFYVMDRGYFCSDFFKKIDEKGAFFVSRIKKNINYYTISEKTTFIDKNIIWEKKISFSGEKSSQYGDYLRLIKVRNSNGKEIEIITNDFSLETYEIAELYKNRWQIELFFKWIKQNLKIKKFLGLSKNAVYLQLWIALICYLLLWRLYHSGKYNFQNFLECIRFVRTRIFEVDSNIRFSKWKEELKIPQKLLFES